MRKILIPLLFVIVVIKNSSCDQKRDEELIMQRRSFFTFFDDDKLRSYLFSFGGSPTAEESRSHMVYKRASGHGRVRKLKKVPSVTAASAEKDEKILPPEPKRNMTISPRHMIKFEMEDAKYSEEYEQLKKSRKLRSKRSARGANVYNKNSTAKMDRFVAPDTFMQPKEFLRFLLTDAITSQPLKSNYNNNNDKKSNENEKKTVKREVSTEASNADSSASDSIKKVKITHPLSSASRTKHVSLDELPAKLQKMIESALTDAVTKGKANDGDYLKIYYGDKVIKIPVSMSKHIPLKVKETTTAKSVIESYVHKTVHKYPKEDDFYHSTYDSSKYYLPTTTEKAESYVNFVTPKDNSPHVEEIHHLPPKKSIYYFSSEEDATPSFPSPSNTLTSPGPVIFQSSTPSTLTSFSDLSKNYKSHIVHQPTSSPSLSNYKTIIKEVPHHRDTIPITEEIVGDSLYYKPIKTIQHIDLNTKPIPIPPPTSFIDFSGSTADEHEEKNYEFGYHISDYKTGNSYGHKQTKNKDEITGQYSILLPDGRIQTTKYFADDTGFHADVSYSTIHH